ncbi:MAG: hypothetical protein M2R45_02843 [Verrucomicrobia subdivision 3 bacterium]|nr:hypothetical protein [Limisphaerales bacterium]MCS1415454.1 hypothetical protein [Limisphaerales bacterium]
MNETLSLDTPTRKTPYPPILAPPLPPLPFEGPHHLVRKVEPQSPLLDPPRLTAAEDVQPTNHQRNALHPIRQLRLQLDPTPDPPLPGSSPLHPLNPLAKPITSAAGRGPSLPSTNRSASAKTKTFPPDSRCHQLLATLAGVDSLTKAMRLTRHLGIGFNAELLEIASAGRVRRGGLPSPSGEFLPRVFLPTQRGRCRSPKVFSCLVLGPFSGAF